MIPREHSDLYLLLSFISLYDVPFSSIGRTGYSFFEEEYTNTDGARALCLYFMKDMNSMRRNLIKIRSSAILGSLTSLTDFLLASRVLIFDRLTGKYKNLFHWLIHGVKEISADLSVT